MMRADGRDVSTSTVERALRRHGLLPPRGFRADRKSWAALRRKVFHDPPTERNRVWQTDLSEFETPSGGIWRICAVIDYATRYCLAAKITSTGRGSDASACTSTSTGHPSTTAAPWPWKPPASATFTTASGRTKRSDATPEPPGLTATIPHAAGATFGPYALAVHIVMFI